jgi:ATP-dependent helicase/nuclease subunit A
MFTLAHHRPDKSFLWESLRNSDHTKTLAVLNDQRSKSDFLRPYDLIERILTRHDGRRKLLARLGPEAEDGIDAMLSQALGYESTGVPSLTGFLTWMETDDLEVKRQMESQGDRIRVMTVHGAKGLEAPIVILPDTAKRDVRVNQELLPADNHLIWKTPTKTSAPAVTALRDAVIAKQARERMRLLYVAMTRAEKWLIVGAAGEVGEGDASWYNIVADGMDRRAAYDAALGDMPLRRVSELDWGAPTLVAKEAVAQKPVKPPQFSELAIQPSSKTIAPSELPGAKIMPGDPAGENIEDAMARGTQIHLLLEHLPMVAKDQRHKLGLQLLQTDDATLVDEVIVLIEKPELGWLWDTNALTEVVITADIPKIGRIHGAIDRLIIGPDTITAVDYKSNRLVPDAPEETPIGLQRQLAAYDHALREIYPDHQITTTILWTHTGTLTVLPQQHLHDALNAITTS